MSDINFSCPKCKMAILCDDSYIGSPIECPGCDSRLVVPASAKRVAPTDIKTDSCPECSSNLPSHAVICAKCGYNVKTGKASQKVNGPPARSSQSRVKESTGFTIKKLLIGSLVVGLLGATCFWLFADLPSESPKISMSIGAFLIGAGTIMTVVPGLMILINAFRESIAWGLGFFVPVIGGFVSLLFVIKHWGQNGQLFLTNLGGTILLIGGFSFFSVTLFDDLDEGFPIEFVDTGNPGVSTGPEAAVIQIAHGLANNDTGVLWDALPPSYQNDINTLIHEYANAEDPKAWERSSALTRRVANVLEDKKEFLFNSPIFATIPDKEVAKKNFDSMLKIMNVVIDSDLSNLDKLKSVDLGKYLNTTGSEMLKEISVLMDAAPGGVDSNPIRNLANVSVNVIRSDDQTATLSVTFPGEQPAQFDWIKFEDRWVPLAMTEEWPEMMAAAQEAITTMKNEPEMSAMQTAMMFGMAEGTVSQFESANSQKEFDAAIEGIMGGMMGAGPGNVRAAGGGRKVKNTPEVEDKVFAFHRQKALAGNPSSQYEMGLRYLRGDGVGQDVEQARNWLTLAAGQGHNRAQIELDRLNHGSDISAESAAIATGSLNSILAASSDAASNEDPSQEEIVARLNDARIYAQGVILFSEANRQRLPKRLDETLPLLREANLGEPSGRIQFELFRPGESEHSFPVIPKPKIIILRSSPWQQKDERWGRIYGFADGHSELKIVADGKFAAWEKAH